LNCDDSREVDKRRKQYPYVKHLCFNGANDAGVGVCTERGSNNERALFDIILLPFCSRCGGGDEILLLLQLEEVDVGRLSQGRDLEYLIEREKNKEMD